MAVGHVPPVRGRNSSWAQQVTQSWGATQTVSGRASVIPPCHRGPFQLWWYLGRDGMGWAGPRLEHPQGNAPPPRRILRGDQ